MEKYSPFACNGEGIGGAVEIRQLRYFTEVCLSGSITQAAENLSMTQPALSQQISLLERELKAELFDRSNRGITLTPAGEAFAAKVQDVLTRLAELAESVRPPEALPQITFASGETLAAHFVPRLVADLRVKFPGIRLRVIESNLTEIRAALRDDTADFALSPEAIGDAAYINRYLIEDQILPAVSTKDPLAAKRNSDWAALRGAEWILFHSGSAIRKISNGIFHDVEKKFVPKIAMELRSVAGVVRCIEEGCGIGFISNLSLTDRLTALVLPELTRRRQFFLTFKKKNQHLSAVIEAILKFAAGGENAKT